MNVFTIDTTGLEVTHDGTLGKFEQMFIRHPNRVMASLVLAGASYLAICFSMLSSV